MNKSLYRASTAVLALTAITNSLGPVTASAAEAPVTVNVATQEQAPQQTPTEVPATAPVAEATEASPETITETPQQSTTPVESSATEAPAAEETTEVPAPVAAETQQPAAVQQAPTTAKSNVQKAVENTKQNNVQENVEKATAKTNTTAVNRTAKAAAVSAKAVPTTIPASGDVKQDIKEKVNKDVDNNLLGIAQNFHIFANEANLKTHTNGNVAIGKLTGANANFGTNIKEAGPYQNTISDISYIQSIATGVNLIGSSGVAERDTLLVVGEGIAVDTTDNGNAYTVNSTKLDNIKHVQKDAAGTTYINFENEFNTLRAVSKSLASGDIASAEVYKGKTDNQGNFQVDNDYVLDLDTFEADDNKRIVLNLDAEDLIHQGTFKVKNIPNDATVVINVVSDKVGTSMIVDSEIKLEYKDGTTRSVKETENFTDSTLLWNFGAYAGLITLNKAWQGTILATEASLGGGSNIDGSIIVNKFLGAGETHRWDFQGTTTPGDDTDPGSESDSESTSEGSDSDSTSESTSEGSDSDSTSESTSEGSDSDSTSESTSEGSDSDSTSDSTSEGSDSDSTSTSESTNNTPTDDREDDPEEGSENNNGDGSNDGNFGSNGSNTNGADSGQSGNTSNNGSNGVDGNLANNGSNGNQTVAANNANTYANGNASANGAQGSTDATGLPQTGDGTTAAAGLGLGALFAGAMALIAARRKKK